VDRNSNPSKFMMASIIVKTGQLVNIVKDGFSSDTYQSMYYDLIEAIEEAKEMYQIQESDISKINICKWISNSVTRFSSKGFWSKLSIPSSWNKICKEKS
jgi:hypothetical protein